MLHIRSTFFQRTVSGFLALWLTGIPQFSFSQSASGGNDGIDTSVSEETNAIASASANTWTGSVNLVPPSVYPPLERPAFSAAVDDRELFNAHVFEEPLVPNGPRVDLEHDEAAQAENNALAAAITEFLTRTKNEQVSPITAFLAKYPNSRWAGCLQLNLGIVYRLTGRYTKAFEAFEGAWESLRDANGGDAKALGDRALAELAEINARVGRKERLTELIAQADQRSVVGAARERLVRSREGLWGMMNTLDKSFLCGPVAVSAVQKAMNPAGGVSGGNASLRSTANGTSLQQNSVLAKEKSLDLQIAKRSTGAAILVPSVVHWKVGHYGAIVKESGGRYLVDDKTYHYTWWVDASTIDEEASGYFLVPNGSLPQGWSSVSEEEAKSVWGKGDVGGANPDDITSDDEKVKDCPPQVGMAGYNMHALTANITISDVPLEYTPPYGPSISLVLTYNHREAAQPQVFNYFNFGRKWTCNWVCFLKDDPFNASADVHRYSPAGGQQTFTGYDAATQSYGIHYKGGTILKRISTSPIKYELSFPDGSKEVFGQADGVNTFPRRVFLTQRIDPAGNAIVFTYDANLRLAAVTDALGQVTTLTYGLAADPLKITKVTDPFGRFATFEYTPEGRLWKITDPVNITSEFTYSVGDFIETLTTPYGDTKFSAGEGADWFRWCEVKAPDGKRERVEYRRSIDAPSVAESCPQRGDLLTLNNSYLHFRNSFYWDKKAMADAPGDFQKAHVFHWLHAVPELNRVANILESEKRPLHGRVWYTYQGQTDAVYATGITIARPSNVVRLVTTAAGTNPITQVVTAEYNAQGNITKTIDPSDRTTKFYYDPTGIDLLSVKRVLTGTSPTVESPLIRYTYNNNQSIPHLPATAKDVSGNVTSYTYNQKGQIKTVTDPLNNVTTFNYEGGNSGYLASVDGPLSGSADSTTLSYDNWRNVKRVTRSDGYFNDVEYDALRRPTKVTYPDATFEQYLYYRLEPEWIKDREGKWTHLFYSNVQQLVAVQDPLNRWTQMDYCGCGALRLLVDGAGHRTQWFLDLAGRPTAKLYEDGGSVKQLERFEYFPTSGLLQKKSDPDGRETVYAYNEDNSVANITYPSSGNTFPVSFTYDTSFARLATVSDQTGTTTFTYKGTGDGSTPALGRGMLSNVTGPVTAGSTYSIDYTYEEHNRLDTRTSGAITTNYRYDAMGRVDKVTNGLGFFAYNYIGATGRLDTVTYGATSTATKKKMVDFDYFDGLGDFRLKQIRNSLPNSVESIVSQFDYTYRPGGQINTWRVNQDPSGVSRLWSFGYDDANQLVSASKVNTFSGVLQSQYGYKYDAAGNRNLEQVDRQITSASFNALNQMTGRGSAGAELLIRGTLNEAGTVTIAGRKAAMETNQQFSAWVPVTPGANSLPIEAVDGSGNHTSGKSINVTVTTGVSATHSFDKTGNMLSDGTRSYEWDVAGRLVKITQAGTVTEFVYDGFGRRVAEKLGGVVVKRWVWDGWQMMQERDAAGNVTKRFYPQGVSLISSGITTDYLYYRDHLGSIREMSKNSVEISARYEYDPYGNRSPNLSTSTNPKESDFGFTGHYFHTSTGLHLAPMRVYDSRLGRWLSRDPIGDRGGVNLYGYVENDPGNDVDSTGCAPDLIFINPKETELYQNMLRYKPPANTITVAGHGGPGFIVDQEKRPIPLKRLRELVINLENYSPNKQIWFLSCHGGAIRREPTLGIPPIVTDKSLNQMFSMIVPNEVVGGTGFTFWGRYPYNPALTVPYTGPALPNMFPPTPVPGKRGQWTVFQGGKPLSPVGP